MSTTSTELNNLIAGLSLEELHQLQAELTEAKANVMEAVRADLATLLSDTVQTVVNEGLVIASPKYAQVEAYIGQVPVTVGEKTYTVGVRIVDTQAVEDRIKAGLPRNAREAKKSEAK